MRLHYLGLVVTGSTLVACLLVFIFLYQNSTTTRHETVRNEGKLLINYLKTLPADNLSLPVLLERYRRILPEDFAVTGNVAYLVLRDPTGKVAAEITKPGIVIPDFEQPPDPGSWNYERTVGGEKNTFGFLEFCTPLLNNGELSGSITVGLSKPGFSLFRNNSYPAITILAPIVLLGVFLYFFFKQQTGSVQKLGRQLLELPLDNITKIELTPGSATTGALVEGLNRFADHCRGYIQKIEWEQTAAIASDKVLCYRKARLETILERLADGIMVLDHSSMVTFANSAVETLIGRDRETILGNKFHEWCDESVAQFLARYQGNDSRLFRSECMDYHPNHAPEKTISLTAYPLTQQGVDLSPLGTLVVLRDITAHVLAKQSSGDFVAHVAHELKSPLNVISMYSEMLVEEDGKDKSFRIEAVNTIHDEVDRLNLLISHLLKISKLELGNISLERQRVKLPELLKDVFDTISRNGKEKNLDFKLHTPDQLSPLFVDKELLRVALNNLLTNAIKYNRPNGSVTLTAFETDNTISIQVEDTGVGIPAEDQGKIFEKFYRVDNEVTQQRSGHGLGLTLAENIITLHHGKLLVKSTLGQGTLFSIVFTKEGGLVREGL
jgi:two-component system phosphate regulon sensor histidine kinase PhoR